MMLAKLTKTAELQLDKDESKMLAEAIQSVASHYDFLDAVSPEFVAWSNLASVAAFVYGPRVLAIMSNRKKQPEPEVYGPGQPTPGDFPHG